MKPRFITRAAELAAAALAIEKCDGQVGFRQLLAAGFAKAELVALGDRSAKLIANAMVGKRRTTS